MRRRRRVYILSEKVLRAMDDDGSQKASRRSDAGDGAGHTSKPQTLEAQAFVLKDRKGSVRARLDCSEQGPYLALLDPSGTPRAALLVAEADPHLCLYDGGGKIRLHLSLAGEWPTVSLHDKHPLGATCLEVSKASAHLSLGHPQGGAGFFFSVGPGGTSADLFESFGSFRRAMRVRLTRAGPILTLNAITGGPRIELSVRQQKPIFAFLDKKGDRILTLTVIGKKPLIRVQGPKGRPARLIRLEDLIT